MNDQLAKTLGINFVERRKGQNNDLTIVKSKDGDRYNFSFSGRDGAKMGDYFRVAPTDKRLYIAPGCKDNYGFKLRRASASTDRRYCSILASTVGNISGYIGSHAVKYDSDLDVYFVTKGE